MINVTVEEMLNAPGRKKIIGSMPPPPPPPPDLTDDLKA